MVFYSDQIHEHFDGTDWLLNQFRPYHVRIKIITFIKFFNDPSAG
jgi:hypothetical protein